MDLSAGDLATLTAQTTASTAGLMQWLKQFQFWRNHWCKIAAPLVGLALTVGWTFASGAIGFTTNGLKADALLLYQAAMVGFGSGIAALIGYEAQKPLGLLSPGPDNHPADAAHVALSALAPQPTVTTPGVPSATAAPINTTPAMAPEAPSNSFRNQGI